jgi:hypothetical protein
MRIELFIMLRQLPWPQHELSRSVNKTHHPLAFLDRRQEIGRPFCIDPIVLQTQMRPGVPASSQVDHLRGLELLKFRPDGILIKDVTPPPKRSMGFIGWFGNVQVKDFIASTKQRVH